MTVVRRPVTITMAVLVLVAATPWAVLVTYPRRDPSLGAVALLIPLGAAALVQLYLTTLLVVAGKRCLLDRLRRHPGGRRLAVAVLCGSVSNLVGTFAAGYWAISRADSQAFHALGSRFDAVYLAVTTSFTADPAGIEPVTSPARLATLANVVLSFLLVAVSLVTAMNRMQASGDVGA
jgi:hypothetical protein